MRRPIAACVISAFATLPQRCPGLTLSVNRHGRGAKSANLLAKRRSIDWTGPNRHTRRPRKGDSPVSSPVLTRIVTYLQDQYCASRKDVSVEWTELASTLGVTEEEIRAALHEAFTIGRGTELEWFGPHAVRLGPKALLEVDRRTRN
jgi:hypothetical protein